MRPRGNWGDRTDDAAKPEPVAAPSACPFCQSPAVTAPAKHDSSTYWRCGTCGEMWNAARLIQGNGNGNRHRRGW